MQKSSRRPRKHTHIHTYIVPFFCTGPIYLDGLVVEVEERDFHHPVLGGWRACQSQWLHWLSKQQLSPPLSFPLRLRNALAAKQQHPFLKLPQSLPFLGRRVGGTAEMTASPRSNVLIWPCKRVSLKYIRTRARFSTWHQKCQVPSRHTVLRQAKELKVS